MPALFENNSAIIFWKLELKITLNYFATGSSSIVFKVNQLPNNGSCNVSPSFGQSFTTLFQITCDGWLDPDGYIERYEYLGLNLFAYLKFLSLNNSIFNLKQPQKICRTR